MWSGQVGGAAVRQLGVRLEQAADDVRRLAAQAEVASLAPWRSSAADAFRGRLGEEVAWVRAAADSLDQAAAAVRRHAVAADSAARALGDLLGLRS